MQLTILKIAGYGKWTLELGSDREHELQMLQASLYGRIQGLFSEMGCLAFPNRYDEFFVASNGADRTAHVGIQKKLIQSFDLSLTMSIGHAKNPFDANLAAHAARRSGTVLDGECGIYGSIEESDSTVTIMHLDIEDLTSVGRTKSPYEISEMVFGLYSKMSEFFARKKALCFFMGGDNFMVLADDESKLHAKEFVDAAKKDGIAINCGIGTGRTARDAARLATESLDTIRKIRDSEKEKPGVYELSCS